MAAITFHKQKQKHVLIAGPRIPSLGINTMFRTKFIRIVTIMITINWSWFPVIFMKMPVRPKYAFTKYAIVKTRAIRTPSKYSCPKTERISSVKTNNIKHIGKEMIKLIFFT